MKYFLIWPFENEIVRFWIVYTFIRAKFSQPNLLVFPNSFTDPASFNFLVPTLSFLVACHLLIKKNKKNNAPPLN